MSDQQTRQDILDVIQEYEKQNPKKMIEAATIAGQLGMDIASVNKHLEAIADHGHIEISDKLGTGYAARLKPQKKQRRHFWKEFSRSWFK